MMPRHRHHQLPKASLMSQRQEQPRKQAIDTYRAEDPIKDICRHLACAKSWLYKWRKRYDAQNPAWGRERSTRPKPSPTQTPDHVAQVIVSLYDTFRHNGTGGSATAIIQALTQHGIEPVPSRRTMYRIVRRHHKEVTSRGSRACMLSRDRCYSTDTVVNV